MDAPVQGEPKLPAYRDWRRARRGVNGVYVAAIETMLRRRRQRFAEAVSQVVAEGVVVSLTSYPARIRRLHLIIDCLLAQMEVPERVVLYLSEPEFPDRLLPPALMDRIGERFEIRFVPENVRSYNKLLFALRDFPAHAVVTCDDDVIFPVDWFARLRRGAAETPGVIVCCRGRRIRLDRHGEFAKYVRWPVLMIPAAPSFWVFPSGFGGVWYPPGALDARVSDAALINRLCPFADDIWFKAMSLLEGTICRSIGVSDRPVWRLFHDGDTPLYRYNLLRGGNDEQIRSTFNYLGITPEMIAALEARAAPLSSGAAGMERRQVGEGRAAGP